MADSSASRRKRNRPRRIGITGAAMLLYILSIGPAERLVELNAMLEEDGPATPGQAAVMTAYLPLVIVASEWPPVLKGLIWYEHLWDPPDSPQNSN